MSEWKCNICGLISDDVAVACNNKHAREKQAEANNTARESVLNRIWLEYANHGTDMGAFVEGFNRAWEVRNDDLEKLVKSATALREAQKAYMADRGNDELGKMVAQRSLELDEVLRPHSFHARGRQVRHIGLNSV